MNIQNHKSNSPVGIALSERAMIANVSIKQWSGRRLDKRITAETNKAHGADSDAGRYNKLLISKDHLAPINKIVGKARNDLYFHTSPWMDTGGRILPAMGYDGFMKEMNRHRMDFERLVNDFVAEYPNYVEESRIRLNGMFNEADYPAVDQIKARFHFDVSILPMPNAIDFRVETHDAERIKQDIEQRTQSAIESAMSDTWTRIAEVVGAMAEKLQAYEPASNGERAKNVFRDSLVSNLDNLVEILPGLNLTNNPNMEKITACMREHLAGLDARELKDNPVKRGETARKAKAIQDAMSQFV